MPELRPEILHAFELLGISIHATREEAARAYKTQALRHHPDKNNDPAATQRFQQLGAAWDICQRHYQDPSRSYATAQSFATYDDECIHSEDLPSFFVFIFEELIFGRYASRRDYHSRQRARQAPFYFANSYSSNDYPKSARVKAADTGWNEQKQAKRKAEYEQRLREFELEIDAEQRALEKQEIEKSKDETKRAAAYQQAFKAARTGDASTVIHLVKEYDLDVKRPEKMSKTATKKRTNFQTLLHAACRCCDETVIFFLLEKGAASDALNDATLCPFHVAVSCGNVKAVNFFLSRRVNGQFAPGCHPSKAAPDGRTPLQIAISSDNAEMVALLSKEATVHDVARCWHQTNVAQFKDILSAKKGFVDPETKEIVKQEAERKLADERAREEQKAADDRAQQAEKMCVKHKQKCAAERLARQPEQQAIEVKKREDELERRKREAEEAARRKAERKAEQKVAAEAQVRAEYQARMQVEAEEVRQAADAQARAEARARHIAEEQERAQRQADEECCRRKAAQVEVVRIQREAKVAAERQEAEADAQAKAEELRVATAENIRQQAAAAKEDGRLRMLEAKRAETIRRLQGQAEEHRRQAEQAEERSAKARTGHVAPVRPKLPKKGGVRDVSQFSAQELDKRAAQSARDKARFAQEKLRMMQGVSSLPRPPKSVQSTKDDSPPTPVSPSPCQQRLPLQPPAIPRHTRPNIQARYVDTLGIVILGPEDIQTGAISDDLFVPEPKVDGGPMAARESAPAPATFRGSGLGYRPPGRGRRRGLMKRQSLNV